MSKAPPWRPRPVAPSSRERGLPRRLWEMNSNPVLLSSLFPLGTDEKVRVIMGNEWWERFFFKPYTGSEIETHLP